MAALQPRSSRYSTPYRDIYIVNSHYNHYGHSVIPSHSRTVVSRTNSCLSEQIHPAPLHKSDTEHSQLSQTSLKSKRSLENNELTPALALVDSSQQKKPKFSYKSLLGQDNKVKKFIEKKLAGLNHTVTVINNLPLEILSLILEYTNDYTTLVNCLYVNRGFYKAAKSVLYASPRLTSTYRVAQLVSSLRENPHNGELIIDLDLSKLTTGLIIDEEYLERFQDEEGSIHSNDENMYLDYSYASWRDWKYRGDPLYGSTLLNSYNMSKSKSVASVDSISTVTTMRLKMFKKVKHGDELAIKFKKLAKLLKFTRKTTSSAAMLKKTIQQEAKPLIGATANDRRVRFNVLRDPKNRPFAEYHPYTNKFLLKYASSKDIPIGYLLYFIQLCPKIQSLNLEGISLSSDFKIKYHDEQIHQRTFSSLVEDVLPENPNLDSKSVIEKNRAHHLSDSNVYMNMKDSHDQLVKLQESDVMIELAKLAHLKYLNLSSISWLNYKVLKLFRYSSNSVEELQDIKITNSGMMRNLNWAHDFNGQQFKDYFAHDVEPEPQVEISDAERLRRRIGMNYWINVANTQKKVPICVL